MIESMNQLFGENFSEMLLRILLATVLCGLIGFERELKKTPSWLSYTYISWGRRLYDDAFVIVRFRSIHYSI